METILFILSSKDEQGLIEQARKYLSLITSTSNISNICNSLMMNYQMLEYKLIISCKNKDALAALLESFIQDKNKLKKNYTLYCKDNLLSLAKIAYVFSGQGGQWFAMGRYLIYNHSVFRNSIKEIDLLLNDIAGWSLFSEMLKNKTESLVNKTEIAQLAIFAIQVSLEKLLRHYGVKAEGIVGHSLGEIAAAYSAGAFSLKEAIYLTYHRGRIQAKQASSGKMLAISISLEEAKKEIEKYNNKVSIATINGPSFLTISGDTDILIKLAKQSTEKGCFTRFVNVEVPYHSYHMDILKEELEKYLGKILAKPVVTPLYSTVSAQKENGLHLTGDYWFRNIREPVLFTDTINLMINDGFNLFIEIGPHPLLVNNMYTIFNEKSYHGVSLALMNRKFEDEESYFIQGLGRLMSLGIGMNNNNILINSE